MSNDEYHDDNANYGYGYLGKRDLGFLAGGDLFNYSVEVSAYEHVSKKGACNVSNKYAESDNNSSKKNRGDSIKYRVDYGKSGSGDRLKVKHYKCLNDDDHYDNRVNDVADNGRKLYSNGFTANLSGKAVDLGLGKNDGNDLRNDLTEEYTDEAEKQSGNNVRNVINALACKIGNG